MTSFNIRQSTTHSYIPTDKLGRVNSIYNAIVFSAAAIASIASGIIANYLGFAYVGYIFGSMALIAAFVFILGNKKQVSKIYNRDI